MLADTSALVKLVVEEAETRALAARLSGQRVLASKVVLTELPRAVGRRPGLVPQDAVASLLDAVGLLDLDDALLRLAGRLPPPGLRSLDALHLAAALDLAGRIDAFVVYDVRLAAAARTAGVPVESPGAAA